LPVAPYRAVLRLERRASHEGMVSVGGITIERSQTVDARARHAKKRALSPQRKRPVSAVEHRSAVRRAHLPDLLAKKSRSTVS
jgi:hypothetical protein